MYLDQVVLGSPTYPNFYSCSRGALTSLSLGCLTELCDSSEVLRLKSCNQAAENLRMKNFQNTSGKNFCLTFLHLLYLVVQGAKLYKGYIMQKEKISIRGKVLERRLPDDVMGKTVAKSLRPEGKWEGAVSQNHIF